MDELEQRDQWSRALRQIAGQRDRLLVSTLTLSPARRATLGAVLAREFPVEAAFRKTAAQRDRALGQPPREIPRAVATDLRGRLATALAREGRPWSSWANLLTRSGLVAACLIAGLGIASLGKWGPVPVDPRHESIGGQPIERVGLAASNQLSLQMSAAELASWRATFLAANSTSLDEDAAAPTRLRLDLPVRALLEEDGIASTP